MSARTDPAGWPQPRTAIEDAAIAWLDALAGGICTPEAFLNAMQEQFLRDRDKGWGILSLLDQYYRRGKIKPELFQILKSRLESSALNSDENVPASVRSHVPAHASPAAIAPSPVAPGPVAPGPVAPGPVAPSAVASSAAAPSHVDPSFAGATGPAPTAAVTNAVTSNAVTAPAAATSPKQAQRAARPKAQEAREIREVAIGDLLRGRY